MFVANSNYFQEDTNVIVEETFSDRAIRKKPLVMTVLTIGA